LASFLYIFTLFWRVFRSLSKKKIYSTWRKFLKISGWISFYLKTLIPMSKSDKYNCVIHKKTKIIFTKIEHNSKRRSKIENSSYRNVCFDVLNNSVRGILKILKTEWMVMLRSVWEIWKKGDQIYRTSFMLLTLSQTWE